MWIEGELFPRRMNDAKSRQRQRDIQLKGLVVNYGFGVRTNVYQGFGVSEAYHARPVSAA